MIITEYRIPFPATVDEYRVGMLYMIARASAEEARRAGNKVAVEVLRNEPYTRNEHGLPPGIYTEKVFHIRNLLPRFLRAFVPLSSARVVEKSWAAYPNRCLTLYYWPYLSARSVMSIESRYLADCGETKNALELSDNELEARRVVTLDIASEEQLGMSADADVSKFQSSRANRGKLQAGVWMRNADPVMCCYKVCRVDVSQSKIEQWGQRLIQSSFIHYNRQALVWMDSWLGLSHDDVSGVSGTALPAACAPFPPEKTRTMVATELATEALGLASLTAFAHADASDPFS